MFSPLVPFEAAVESLGNAEVLHFGIGLKENNLWRYYSVMLEDEEGFVHMEQAFYGPIPVCEFRSGRRNPGATREQAISEVVAHDERMAEVNSFQLHSLRVEKKGAEALHAISAFMDFVTSDDTKYAA